MRIRLTAVTALAMVLAVIAATPATAAPAITRPQVKSSLLTVDDLSKGWHRTAGSGPGSAAPEVTGCKALRAKSVGVAHEADRSFRYRKLPTFIQESVQSFGTPKLARTDFAKSVRLFRSCPRFTTDGERWEVTRLSMPDYAAQRAMYRLTGAVGTAAGDIEITMFLVASRVGRQQVVVLVTVAGNGMTRAVRRGLADSSVRISRVATGKVRDVLGR